MKIKFFALLTLMVIMSSCSAEQGVNVNEKSNLHWYTNLAEAQKVAAESGKPILANFTGSDWCRWCIALNKEVFTKQSFIDYASGELVPVKIDFPRFTKLPEAEAAKNQELAGKYGVRGFPTVMLLNADGSTISRTGYQRGGPDRYVEHLKGLLGTK